MLGHSFVWGVSGFAFSIFLSGSISENGNVWESFLKNGNKAFCRDKISVALSRQRRRRRTARAVAFRTVDRASRTFLCRSSRWGQSILSILSFCLLALIIRASSGNIFRPLRYLVFGVLSLTAVSPTFLSSISCSLSPQNFNSLVNCQDRVKLGNRLGLRQPAQRIKRIVD